jgi:Phage P22-like portal protein
VTDKALEDGEDAETSDDEAIISEAKDRYQACEDADGDNRSNALDDLRFLSGGENQWDEEAVRIRTLEKRPMLTVNNLPTFLHQITNDQRQNKIAIKAHPVGEGADEETADVIQGLIRHIEYDSNGSVSYNTSVNSAAAIGFGYFRLVTEYESEKSFDQKIMFKRIRNALSVRIDPLSQEPDGSDMKYCFIESLMSRSEFRRQYPDADANDTTLIGKPGSAGWYSDTEILVTEYYRIKETEATLCEYSDGSTGWKDEAQKIPGVSIKRERKSAKRVVEWFKLTGADVLERTEIKCKWIPVFPVYGDEIDINGKVIRSGVIRHAKDSFKAYNYWITCATEEISLRPKSPFIMAEGQDEGHEDEWAAANVRSFSSLKYKPVSVDGTLAPPPQRQAMADVPTGMLAMMMHAADNKKATTGLYDSSLGAKGSATSGKQEMAQQRQGDVANFHYSDNLNIVARHVGRCIVNMLPSYYDGERVVRILGEDDAADSTTINQPMQEPVVDEKTGAIKTVLNDMCIGVYDITVKAGPAFDTQRQEAAEFMTNAMQAAKDPATANVLTYLAMKNQDIPGSEEATKMLKKLLPPGIAEPDDDEEKNVVQTHKGPLPIEQVPQAIQMMDQQIQALTAQGPEIQKQAEAVKAEASQVAQEKAALESQRAQLDAKTRELKLLEQLAAKTLEAQDARTDADRTKIITDMKLLVGEAIQRLEGMKQQAEQVKAGEDGAAVEAKNKQAEAKNQEVTGIQNALTNQLTEAITLLAKVSAAPRKTTLENNASGMPVSAVSEPVM